MCEIKLQAQIYKDNEKQPLIKLIFCVQRSRFKLHSNSCLQDVQVFKKEFFELIKYAVKYLFKLIEQKKSLESY